MKKQEAVSVTDMVAKAAMESKRLAAQRQDDSDEDDEEEEGDKEQPKISKKKLRRLNRLSVAQLKQLVERPDVVEMHDVTAPDPQLLIHLKVYRGQRSYVSGHFRQSYFVIVFSQHATRSPCPDTGASRGSIYREREE